MTTNTDREHSPDARAAQPSGRSPCAGHGYRLSAKPPDLRGRGRGCLWGWGALPEERLGTLEGALWSVVGGDTCFCAHSGWGPCPPRSRPQSQFSKPQAPRHDPPRAEHAGGCRPRPPRWAPSPRPPLWPCQLLLTLSSPLSATLASVRPRTFHIHLSWSPMHETRGSVSGAQLFVVKGERRSHLRGRVGRGDRRSCCAQSWWPAPTSYGHRSVITADLTREAGSRMERGDARGGGPGRLWSSPDVAPPERTARVSPDLDLPRQPGHQITHRAWCEMKPCAPRSKLWRISRR